MAATRSMACASCTEVPPNFITIMAALPPIASSEIALCLEQLAVEDGGPGGATDGVMRKDCKSPVKNVAGAQPPHHGGHTASAVTIEPRLGTIRCGIVVHRLLRG